MAPCFCFEFTLSTRRWLVLFNQFQYLGQDSLTFLKEFPETLELFKGCLINVSMCMFAVVNLLVFKF